MLPKIICVVLIVVLAAVFLPRLIHKCDNCEKIFVGTGYNANVISDLISDIQNKDEKILCKDCAEKEHPLAGDSLKDYKRPLF